VHEKTPPFGVISIVPNFIERKIVVKTLLIENIRYHKE